MAIPAGLRMAAHRAGRTPDATRWYCRRRARFDYHWLASGSRCYEPGLFDGETVRALSEMVWHRFQTPALRLGALANALASATSVHVARACNGSRACL